MNSNKAYYFERLNEQNFKHFVNLYNKVYQKNYTLELLQQKYNTQHIVEGYYLYIAFSHQSNEAVASFGAVPYLFKHKNKSILAAQASDAMTTKEHRGNRLFSTLHQKVVELLKQKPFQFYFAFPNQNSHPIFLNKFNWEEHNQLQLFLIPTSARIPTRKIAWKLPYLTALHNQFIERIFKKYAINFSPEDQAANTFQVHKNKAFYQYKANKMHKCIQIEDTIFWIKITNHLQIGDVYIKNKKHFPNHLNQLCKLAAKIGVPSISFNCSSNHPLNATFSQYYPSIPSLPVVFLELSPNNIHYNNIQFTQADIDTF